MLFTKRSIIALAVSFIVMFVCGNSLAADLKPNEPKRGEVSEGGSFNFSCNCSRLLL